LKRTDKNRARYQREYYDRDWDDPANYDMVLNTGRLLFDGATSVIVARARERWGLKPEQEPPAE
jgi:cytidylate kinase